MRRLSVVSLLTALVLLILCACGSVEVQESSVVEENAVEQEAEPKMPTIGTKTESNTEAAIEVKNATGEAITSWRVKFTGEEEYCDNLLADDDTFMQNTTRMLYLDPKNEDANRLCDIEVTFEDYSATIHNFPLDDADYVEICKEGEVVYLIYNSQISKKEINTLEEEQAIFDAAQAAKTTTNTTSSGSGNYSGGSSSYSGSSGSGGSSGYSEPAGGGDSGSSGESDDGCIGDDGLLY